MLDSNIQSFDTAIINFDNVAMICETTPENADLTPQQKKSLGSRQLIEVVVKADEPTHYFALPEGKKLKDYAF
jgi:hypothetical protein